MQNVATGDTTKSNESNEYPIIRCEDCHEIPIISFQMDKKEIQLKCEKEGKVKNIPFETFFSTIQKYNDVNCCQFCTNKNPSQKYYLCKTCSNKLLCENCFNVHNKNDDIIKFNNNDSICKKHYYPYESYCQICKENKCSYCSLDHEESHESEEILLKKKIAKKNKLNEFKKRIKKIKSDKDKIDQKIKSVVKELEEKIEFINNLKEKFFDFLNMKLQFVELIMNNYEKKLNSFDLNYFIIQNFVNQNKFDLLEFNLNTFDSLENKIKTTTDYMNKNINSQFILEKKQNDNENDLDNYITDVDYEVVKEFDYKVKGFFDFNSDLFAFYSINSLFFISKNNFEKKLEIKEYLLEGINICKKINEEKVLVYTGKNIIIIDIIDNSDYLISTNINLSCDVYDFNSNFDFLCLDIGKNVENSKENEKYSIKYFSFPEYNQSLFSCDIKKDNIYQKKLHFNKKNMFFFFSSNNLHLYEIKDEYRNKSCSLKASVKVNTDTQNASIIDLNQKFYCLYDNKKIFLLNKTNLIVSKTISINLDNIGILKITNKLITIFTKEQNKLTAKNYDILSNGIQWKISKTKQLYEKDMVIFIQSNNYILFLSTSQKNCGLLVNIKAQS